GLFQDLLQRPNATHRCLICITAAAAQQAAEQTAKATRSASAAEQAAQRAGTPCRTQQATERTEQAAALFFLPLGRGRIA
ncbi:hypothetical protein KC219_27605, partial [Mycobacterium tuberculosis]|nr:hypothetical protein [Mycobacterium tuberculosis]